MFELIIKDIMEVVGYLPIGILCGCIAVVVYLVYTVSPAGKKVSAGGRVKKSIVWFLLVVYLAVMAVTVFLSREPGSRQGIDMTLFHTWGVTPQEHAFVIENILLFVPFGVLFPLAVAGSKNGDGRAVDRLSKCTVLFGFLNTYLITIKFYFITIIKLSSTSGLYLTVDHNQSLNYDLLCVNS